MTFKLVFDGDNVTYDKEAIVSKYSYSTTTVSQLPSKDGAVHYSVKPVTKSFSLRTDSRVPKTGVMLVGWGGNNGSTMTAIILANKHNMKWATKDGEHHANYYGSIVMSSSMCFGTVTTESGVRKVCTPMSQVLPFTHPNDLKIDGWDINKLNIGDSMKRAKVLDLDLQRQLHPLMKGLTPRPSIYNPAFIASNQKERADNVIPGTLKEQLAKIRDDIKDFKKKEKLDKVIVLWTASTECYTELNDASHKNADTLLKAIEENKTADVAPSTLFAVASILEGCPYINGSPQNCLYSAVQELASRHKVFIAGDDFKTGQTKVKSALVEFLIGSGIKPVCIASYNHLGNNDGYNLSSYKQFRSKEISKSNVIDELVEANHVLYKPGEKPDHCIVIKYLPYVGDSKRAMDEYTSEICMGGHHTLVIHNTCEDSLLASPVMLDLVLLCEFFSRVQLKFDSESDDAYQPFHAVLSILSFLLKAPLVSKDEPLINGLNAQLACIENWVRACLGIPPENHMYLEHKFGIKF